MTLDEAIKHAEEVAEKQEMLCTICVSEDARKDKKRCAEEHRQLAEWLKELKHLRNIVAYSTDFHCSVEKAEKMLKVAEEKIRRIEELND